MCWGVFVVQSRDFLFLISVTGLVQRTHVLIVDLLFCSASYWFPKTSKSKTPSVKLRHILLNGLVCNLMAGKGMAGYFHETSCRFDGLRWRLFRIVSLMDHEMLKTALDDILLANAERLEQEVIVILSFITIQNKYNNYFFVSQDSHSIVLHSYSTLQKYLLRTNSNQILAHTNSNINCKKKTTNNPLKTFPHDTRVIYTEYVSRKCCQFNLLFQEL